MNVRGVLPCLKIRYTLYSNACMPVCEFLIWSLTSLLGCSVREVMLSSSDSILTLIYAFI